jgi:hypothetical protein
LFSDVVWHHSCFSFDDTEESGDDKISRCGGRPKNKNKTATAKPGTILV